MTSSHIYHTVFDTKNRNVKENFRIQQCFQQPIFKNFSKIVTLGRATLRRPPKIYIIYLILCCFLQVTRFLIRLNLSYKKFKNSFINRRKAVSRYTRSSGQTNQIPNTSKINIFRIQFENIFTNIFTEFNDFCHFPHFLCTLCVEIFYT